MIKLSDYVARFLHFQGIEKIFVLQGAASAHLIDSVAKEDGIEYVCNAHEQACAMAADGYARVTGKMGVAIATSGPGAQNLLTGCCSSFYDSVPILFLTGQVPSDYNKGDLGVRQLGFQETETIKIFEPVVKYCVLLKRPEDIRYELEKAVYIALHGRKGPVLIDIPDDFQRAMIDEVRLRSYIEEREQESGEGQVRSAVYHSLSCMRESKRPLIVAGRGIHLSGGEEQFIRVLHQLRVPCVLTWGSQDLLEEDDALKVGTIGVNGTRYGNYAVGKADFILILGSRLDVHVAGGSKKFGKQAKKIIVDIDKAELSKYKVLGFETVDLVNCDIKKYLLQFQTILSDNGERNLGSFCWIERLRKWKRRYPICPKAYYKESEINPYVFIRKLSEYAENQAVLICDTGCSLVWANQAFVFKKDQRIHSSFNNTPMGYALPAAIGAAMGTKERILCITGDGGLLMNIQELTTAARHNLDILVLLFCNRGYGMIQKTQDRWFDSRYEGSDENHGLAFPDFEKIFEGFGFHTTVLEKQKNIVPVLQEAFHLHGPSCVIIKIPLNAPMYRE